MHKLRRIFDSIISVVSRVSQTGPSALLGGHEQMPLLGSFAKVFTSIAKPKCHDLKYSLVKLKFIKCESGKHESR